MKRRLIEPNPQRPCDVTVGKEYEINDVGGFIDDVGELRNMNYHTWEDEVETNSGDSCNYYIVSVDNPISLEDTYTAECYDLIKALKLTWEEANIFKEIWRTGNARNNNGKKGNTDLRAAEKINFFAKQNLSYIKLEK